MACTACHSTMRDYEVNAWEGLSKMVAIAWRSSDGDDLIYQQP